MNYNIIMPSKPRVVSEDGNKGVYEIDGLYAGYGHTAGNSLRRIILSSMPGAVVTKVKIEGAPHEFSVLQGVKEDVISILLNIKKIRFHIEGDEPQVITVSASGVKDITAKDIKCPDTVKVMNGDQHIVSLTNKNSKFEIEMTVENGLGYIPREVLYKDKVDVGTIVLDANFTPVRRVNYEVENMRVGDRTDYNRLRFMIETDGSISPADALQKSIQIMIAHLRAIVGFEESEIVSDNKPDVMEDGGVKKEAEDDKEVMKIKLDDLQLSSRTINVLNDAGIKTIGGLARKKESDLMKSEGVGAKTIQEIKRALGNYGLTMKE
jgi:DNA-directed RNA polymerase subunit alpha